MDHEPGSAETTAHITMQDVARRAGVSAQTVSNVVNGRSARVGAETTQRVVEAINDLGYRLNQSARSLRKGRTGIVGLGLPLLALEYYGELADRLADRFAAHGVRMVVENTGGALTAEVESLAASHLETYDGFILAVAASESADLNVIAPSKPIVLLGERALSARFDHVVMDNRGGGRLATEALLARGARSIVALGGATEEGDSVETLRTRGYLDAHEAVGVPVRPDLIVDSGLHIADGYHHVRALLDAGTPFDGIFALTDANAMGAVRALNEDGRRIPGEVQIIGFDNVTGGRFHTPALSTIEPGNEEMADAIVDLMLRRLSGAGLGSPQRIMSAASLVLRETTRDALG
ncbi:LacI family transcriptional regulator [Microbacterium sp. 4R-513]|uniref:LacI family DNA-binding transcriptional regulator n=1 Tax=Microbacterium sp. 4R-513 TaxID=2567934 RepID=UPI0013E1A9E3|nr:LacI family DNA-binding transcriptional regulator [Microbacterium sp. 4R-513]QIG39501.1 LacI family transcriptional regulator [Microbacterium sp. 4R-513]